jgi:tripartite-type tricarboxylate transporter receptor subunit TctC
MIGSPEANTTNYISGSLKAPANKDMIYVCSVAYDANVLCVAPGTYANWTEFVAAAKANPGKLNIASVGSMNSMQASIADVLLKADIKSNYVPFDSASKSRTAVMGKKADALWCQLSEAKPFLDSGELVGIAIAAKKRTDIAPKLQTFSEMGVEAVSGIHRAMLLPPKTPANIVAYYEKKIKEVYDKPEFKKTMQDKMGYSVEWVGTNDMVKRAAEIQAWGEKYMKIIANK